MVGLPFDEAEYRGRQSRFLAQVPVDSLVLIPTNPTSTRSNDVTYPYRANSSVLYLCGWSDPDAILMAQHGDSGWNVSLFVQPHDTLAEIWEGRRIGVEGAVAGWPIDSAHSLDDLEDVVIGALSESKAVHLVQKLHNGLDELVNSALNCSRTAFASSS